MKKLLIFSFAFLSLTFFYISSSLNVSAATWDITPVDTEFDAGEISHMAVDSDGRYLISYTFWDDVLSQYNLRVVISEDKGLTWDILDIVDTGEFEFFHSLFIDKDDVYNIAYFDYINGIVKIAQSTDYGITWNIIDVYTTTSSIYALSLTADINNKYLLAFTDYTRADVLLSTSINSGTTWTIPDLVYDLTASIPFSVFIKAKSADNILIIYTDCTSGIPCPHNLNKILTTDGGTNWTNEVITTIGDDNSMLDISLDQDGNYLICFDIYQPGFVWGDHFKVYKSEDSGSTFTSIYSPAQRSRAGGIAVDMKNNYIVSYHYQGSLDLAFAISEDQGVTWNEETVTTDIGGSVVFPGITTDNGEDYLINFHNETIYALNLAKAVNDFRPPAVLVNNLNPVFYTPNFSITGSANDLKNTVASIEYSLNGIDWFAAQAEDGSFNSSSEQFRINLTGMALGNYVLYVRSSDSAGNVTALGQYTLINIGILSALTNTGVNLLPFVFAGALVSAIGLKKKNK